MSVSVEAVRYLRPMGRGSCKPLLFKCDDGKKYVVKTMSNPRGIRVLANELIAYKLGNLLNLPMVESKIVNIPQQLISKVRALQSLNLPPGPHFGSQFVENSTNGSRKVIPKCTNLHEMPLVIVFDHWINNNDRYDHSANYIVDLNDWKIHLIDHSSCFYGTKWKIRKLNEIKSHIKVYWGKVYQRFVPFIDRDHPFDDALSTLETLSRVQIEEAVAGVPSEWGVSDDELRVLVDFLIERKSHVSKAIQQLKPYFPIWRSTTRS